MVSINEFQNEMNRLHRAFGAIPTSNGMDRYLEKLDEWFRIWSQNYSATSGAILKQMVDKAISDCERLPNFAQLKNLRQTILSELPRASRAKEPCSSCDQSGLVTAIKNEREHSFRCHRCENWRGRYDGIPIWNEQKEANGFVLENSDFDPGDSQLVKGCVLFKEAAPKLYQEILSKHPEMKNAVEALDKPPPISKDMRGPEMPRNAKERLRAESLDLARDADEDYAPF